jgi:chemotaxis protein methyltransferase CheR
MNVTHADGERFREAIASKLGLHFDDTKRGELAELLGARAKAVGAAGVADYFRRLDEREWVALAERLTVGETYFFRYREQFDAFRDVVLPRAASAPRAFRILSAGCSGGDEPYSLAIAILEHAPTIAARAEIVAFDVNPAALARAADARYSAWALREVPDAVRARHFTKQGDAFHVARAAREMVRFERRNLVDADDAFFRRDAFDLVFCRNVIMYFAPETMRAVVVKLAESMRGGAHLFLGHAETLRGISNDFHLRHSHETFYYERKGDGVHASLPVVLRKTSEDVPSVAAAAIDDGSWVDVIQSSSQRVAKLEARSDKSGAQNATARADRGTILEMVRAERFVDALESLGARDDDDPEAKLLRAVLLTNRGALDDAERLCNAILATDDLNAGAHYVTALCREHAGDHDGAIAHDRMATYLEPTFAMPHIHMGILERRAGHFERARVEIVRALELIDAEDPSRILLFGGGFSREALATLCRNEMRRCGGGP